MTYTREEANALAVEIRAKYAHLNRANQVVRDRNVLTNDLYKSRPDEYFKVWRKLNPKSFAMAKIGVKVDEFESALKRFGKATITKRELNEMKESLRRTMLNEMSIGRVNFADIVGIAARFKIYIPNECKQS